MSDNTPVESAKSTTPQRLQHLDDEPFAVGSATRQRLQEAMRHTRAIYQTKSPTTPK